MIYIGIDPGKKGGKRKKRVSFDCPLEQQGL